MKQKSRLTISTSSRGLERVVVHVPAGGPAGAGLALLRRVLPALSILDQQARS